jgi:hypothetical protein
VVSDATRRPFGPPPGLCGTCRHAHRIETRAASVFWLCERSLTDPAYVRYPALPMLRCAGFEPRDAKPATARVSGAGG